MQESNKSALPIVGILGDGQLSMMMAEAYTRLGGQSYIFAESENGPASGVADKVFLGRPDSVENLADFFAAVDVVTLENEFIDSQVLIDAADQYAKAVLPSPARFALIEDKLSEKKFFASLGVKVADFFEAKSEADLLDQAGFLKLAKGGYDGIGTYKVNNLEEARTTYSTISEAGQVLFEHAIDYQRELSLIAVSNREDVVFYPMVETHQEQGTCRTVTFPAGISAELEDEAKAQVLRIMQKLDTCGLFAFEYFLTRDQELILNESAPRPHNSGHITLDLSDCSQFENHMRAVAGLPLIQPTLLQPSMTMINLLGTQNGPVNEDKIIASAAQEDASLTLYRKQQSRVKRKMGHINLWGSNQPQRAADLIRDLEI